MDSRTMRRNFLRGLRRGLAVVWPILSGLLGLMVVFGLAIGLREGWSIQESVYFAFVTGLTIGYGDFAPKFLLTRGLAILIGLCGLLLTAADCCPGVCRRKGIDRDDGGSRAVKYGVLLGLSLCPTSVFGQIDSLEQFGEFAQTYYAEPRPDLIPAALTFLDTSPLVSNPQRSPIVTMTLSCILHRAELKSRSWDAELAKLHEPALGLVQDAISTGPEALLSLIPVSPARNDMNWACFFGTGEERYLDNLVEVLTYLEEREDLNRFMTGASAQWSLSSNALDHPRVKAKLEQLRATKGPLQEVAGETLAKSPEEIKAEASAVVKDQHQRGVW